MGEAVTDDGLPWERTMELRFACEGATGFKMLEQKWVRPYTDADLDCWTCEEKWVSVPYVDVGADD